MDQEKKGTSIFLKFVQKNDLESLRSYVEGLNSYNVNGVCLKNGETSLHVASRQGYLELLRSDDFILHLNLTVNGKLLYRTQISC